MAVAVHGSAKEIFKTTMMHACSLKKLELGLLVLSEILSTIFTKVMVPN